jgi:hypothetical protein
MPLHVKVRLTRPRVYLFDDLLPEVRRRTATTHVEEWSQLVVWSRGIAKTPPAHRLRAERMPERARKLAFLYSVRRDEKDVEFALELAPRLAELPPRPRAVEALAGLYDAFGHLMPARLGREVVRSLADGARMLYEGSILRRPVLGEARSEAIAPLFAAGLALYGEDKRAQELVGQAVHATRDLLGTLEFFLEEDGGFPLGWAESFVHVGQVPKLALLAESGLGQSWPGRVPWLERYPRFLEAGMRPVPGGAKDGPRWAGGGRTGARRADLWRALVFISTAPGDACAARLLSSVRLPGHQDEKIVYERRPEERPREVAETPPASDRDRTALFFRRAGIAVLKAVLPSPGLRKPASEDLRAGGPASAKEAASDRPEEPDVGGVPVEVVLRCPAANLAGTEERETGSFSVAFGEEVLPGRGRASNGLVIAMTAEETSAALPAGSFPRSRRELNLPGVRRCEVLTFEAGVGGGTQWRAGFDWLEADLTRSHAGAAESVVRTFVFLRPVPGAPWAALVVADRVRLSDPGARASAFVHFSSRPELLPPARAEVATDEACLTDHVLLPADPEMWVDETLGVDLASSACESETHPAAGRAPPTVFRLRIAPRETRRVVRFCQVLVADSGGPGRAGPAPHGEEAPCRLLPADGLAAIEVAGRAVVLGTEDAVRDECVSRGEIGGLCAVGFAPHGRMRLEVAGEEPLEAETSEFGAAYFERPEGATVPRATGFVLTIE